MLKVIFYFAMDDGDVKMLSSFTYAMCSSKISANTHCDTRLKISYVPQEKEPPPVGTLLPHSPSGWPPLQDWPNLASVFPGNHPEIRWNCNIFNCFDKDVRTSTTSWSALNWLRLCKQAAHKHNNHLLECFPDSGSTHNWFSAGSQVFSSLTPSCTLSFRAANFFEKPCASIPAAGSTTASCFAIPTALRPHRCRRQTYCAKYFYPGKTMKTWGPLESWPLDFRQYRHSMQRRWCDEDFMPFTQNLKISDVILTVLWPVHL